MTMLVKMIMMVMSIPHGGDDDHVNDDKIQKDIEVDEPEFMIL